MAAEPTRRFTRNLLKPGSAAEIRHSASHAVRNSTQEKPKLIDPLDYEAVISELEPELKDDPLKDLLLFPEHDFTVSTLVSVCLRTLQSTVPGGAEEQAECLLVREACRYYNSQLHVVEYKHQEYAGDYGMLSR
uniref:Dedicator of cytokinesis C/D N-terminal domain-containing protein n=1 Tax=Electrophorus electricus TaxID=8005 RepID=A0AAY5EEH0_ELEEL